MLKYELTRCYGCEACRQVCLVEAIQMIANHEGFLYPQVDNQKCIGCNKCNLSCSIIDGNREKPGMLNYTIETLAVWDKDEYRILESSSGGAFTGLASYILDNNGVIYGSAWHKDKLIAQHIRVDSTNELHRLKGSKYVQSDIGNSYKHVLEDLKQDRLVLFCGTGCQVAGLKLFLKARQYPNLYTVDLICHGTPSPMMLNAYIEYIERKGRFKISDLKFRDKKKSDPRAYVSYVKSNGQKKYINVGFDPYFNGFNANYFNRESCFKCNFASPQRTGDITIGDYWGLSKAHPELSHLNKNGMSVVLINTYSGKKMASIAFSKGYNVVESTFEKAFSGNRALRRPEHRPEKRSSSYLDMKNIGFEWMVSSYLDKSYSSIYRRIYRIIPWRLIRLSKMIKKII